MPPCCLRPLLETRWQKSTWWPMCFLFLCPAEGVSRGRTLWCVQANGAGSREIWGRGRNFKSQVSFPFVIIIHVRSPLGKSLSALKRAWEDEEERQTRVCPTKHLFEPRSAPLSSSFLCSPQRWNLGSRLNGKPAPDGTQSPEHTSRRLGRR